MALVTAAALVGQALLGGSLGSAMFVTTMQQARQQQQQPRGAQHVRSHRFAAQGNTISCVNELFV